jgi:hypothetical protein
LSTGASKQRGADRKVHSHEGLNMQVRVVLAALAMLVSTMAWADWDPALEAREKAQQDAARRAEQDKQRQIQKMKSDAQAQADKGQMDSKRKTLGASAQGKSDAEVNKLYDAKIKKDTEAAYRGAEAAKSALSTGQGAEVMKQTTGKSMKEMQNMSEAELEAWSKEMEKKYVK